MVIEHFMLANNSSIDVNSNSLSVFGFLDDMQIQAPPGAIVNLQFHAIIVVKREGESGPIHSKMVMTMLGPNKKKVGNDVQIPLSFEPTHRRTRLRILSECPIAQGGNYTIKVSCPDDETLSRELVVNVHILPVAVPTPASNMPQ